jgi:hypothetical protein
LDSVIFNSSTYSRKLSTYIFSYVVILIFYSFGTFAFFNLFALAYLIQALSILCCFIGLIAISFSIQRNKILLIYGTLIFFIYYSLQLAVISGDFVIAITQGFVMMIVASYLVVADVRRINFIIKSIIIITFIFSLMGTFVFFMYAIDPSLVNPESESFMNSSIGSSNINAVSYLDYFSYTSGEGYKLFGQYVTRVKGFSNEPSATIVHYLAPAVFAFFYGAKFRLIGIYILLFSLICISSFIGILAILGTVVAFILLSIKSRIIVLFTVVIGTGVFMWFMVNVEYISTLVYTLGVEINEQTSYGLIAQKGRSANIRLDSYFQAIGFILANPFGGSLYNTMTGLWTQIGLVGGFLVLLFYFAFSFKILNLSIIVFKRADSMFLKTGISLLLSVYFSAFLISGYGWDRVPGVIVLFLFYRMLEDRRTKCLH